VYDPRNNTIKHLGKLQGLSDNTVVDMNLDQQGNIWISTPRGGINEIDPMTWTIRYLNNAPLKVLNQRPLQLDNAGNMWIGTKTGVYIADLKNQKLISLSTPQGLIDNVVISMVKHGNQMYAGTAKGISVITPPAGPISDGKNWKVESFGKLYGLNKVTDGVETDLVTKDGTYWWGDAGLTLLDLTKKDHFIPTVHITGINIMEVQEHFTGRRPSVSNSMAWETVTGPDNMPVNLQLPYNQNYMQFEFSSLNLASHDTVWYKYRLIGADKNWCEGTLTNLSKNYFNLAAGKYIFEVISKSTDNGWSKSTLLTFTINPPWWQTWWAYVLYVVLLAGSIWGFSHYRSLQLIKDKRTLEHKVHVRTEEVRQQKEEIETQRDDLDKAFRELKETQSQLVQREKMASLGELTAGIAHEIQNPLNFVNNFSEVSAELVDEMDEELNKGDIEEAKAIGVDLKQNLEKIRHHGKRADAIVKGMLQHSQSGSGAKEPTNINSLADEYLRLSYHGLRSKDKSFNAEMVTHFDEKLPLINVIPQDIGRVLLNLFNNAFYAVNQKSKTAGEGYKAEVSVSTSLKNGQVVIKVKDNGVGIPDAIKEKIMQPFFTTKPTGEGTGLGLSLTYDMVVKGHGGSISVDTKESSYTEFTVSLPL
jgi:signal transduction histidine kinase